MFNQGRNFRFLGKTKAAYKFQIGTNIYTNILMKIVKQQKSSICTLQCTYFNEDIPKQI